jgi:hypothetical protein
MRAPSRLSLALALTLAAATGALSSGCGARETPVEAPAPPPRARNGGEIAWDIVHARVGAMLYVDRIRNHPIAAKIQSLGLFEAFLEGTGLRLEADLERAFIAAPATDRGDASILVAEHRITNDRVRAAVDTLLAAHRIEGGWIDGASIPMARLTARGQTKVLALIEPNFIVLLPEEHAAEASRFMGTGGFPDPTGPEALTARAIDPARTVRVPRVPPFPPTLQSAAATVVLGADGGADIALEAPSQSPEQAVADAGELTQSVDAATSIKVAFVRVRVFKPIPFFAEGDRVKANLHLTAGEIDTLFGALGSLIPR